MYAGYEDNVYWENFQLVHVNWIRNIIKSSRIILCAFFITPNDKKYPVGAISGPLYNLVFYKILYAAAIKCLSTCL